MREVRISDVTMKQARDKKSVSLTFREKMEISKLLDKLGVSVIELEGIQQLKTDSLLIKSISSAVKESIVAVPVRLDHTSVTEVWNALKEARHPRLQVIAAISPARIEYIYHRKAPKMLVDIEDTIRSCAALTEDVEFVADDASRADKAYLYDAVRTAISAGAKTVTVCDTAGTMLPDEFTAFLGELYENVPELSEVCLGISCSNDLAMADACAFAGVIRGAGEIKAAAYPVNIVSLQRIVALISSKEDICKAHTSVRTTQMKRVLDQVKWMCKTGRSSESALAGMNQDTQAEIALTSHDEIQAVNRAGELLGYDLSEEDQVKVYESFLRIASKKEKVGKRELDAIIASTALQVPPTYALESYVINSGNVISATAFIRLKKGDQILEAVSIGDGPVDASFLALEKIAGKHYELDDFQIQAVTEGHEAMGEAVVKLRSEGKLYSGRGISTDIIGSSIWAYINALNKIVYESEE